MKKVVLLFGVFFLMFAIVFGSSAFAMMTFRPAGDFYFKPPVGKTWQGVSWEKKGSVRLNLTACGHRYLDYRLYKIEHELASIDLWVYSYIDHGMKNKIYERKTVYIEDGKVALDSRVFFADDRTYLTDSVMNVLSRRIEYGQLIFKFGEKTRTFPFGCKKGNKHHHKK